MSKVHGLFLWIAVGLYVLIFNRDQLKYRGIYLSAIITVIIISPLIIWNIQNDFISYKFHSDRVGLAGAGFHLRFFIKALIQEININNPVNFFLICSSLLLAFKGKPPVDKREIKLLLFFSLPLIILVLIISLFRETIAHWSGPAFSCLLILPAQALASSTKNKLRYVPPVIRWAFVYTIFIGLLQVVVINDFPGTLSIQKQGVKTGSQDLTLDMYGWKDIGEKVDSLYKSDVVNKQMPANAPIVITNWSPGATIEYYIANKTKQEVIGIGNVLDLHQYYWSNKYKKQLKDDDSAYYIVPSDDFYYRTWNEVKKSFRGYEMPLIITQYRSGLICRYVSIYRMRGYKKNRRQMKDTSRQYVKRNIKINFYVKTIHNN
jgi:hypothetical protein